MTVLIGQLKKLGKVDGKEEFLLDEMSIDDFNDAFLLPDNISVDDFLVRDRYFITGFRGTGKTSLLRYVLSNIQSESKYRTVILFKSDIEEEKKMQISTQVGAEIVKTDAKKMGISQDFKSAWTWFILHQVAQIVKSNTDLCSTTPEEAKSFLRAMGLGKETPFKKIMGYLPKLDGAKVKIGADIPFFEANLDLNFEREASQTATVLFSELTQYALEVFSLLEFSDPVAIGIDELEVFFHNREQYDRDLCMVRDLIFAVDKINSKARSTKMKMYAVAAIRREVIEAIGSLGQEVNRVTHDRGVSLSWHHAQKSLHHPLINMIRKKIKRSLPNSYEGDPILDFFDRTVDGEPLETFLLDRSFYRPRDMMWRLTFAQNAFPREEKFGHKSLLGTETDYSTQLWNEVEYELSATFSPDEVSAITSIFSGIKLHFFIKDLQDLAESKARYSKSVEKFIKNNLLFDVCEILYSHGAIGNNFRTGKTGSKPMNRWVFRGDPKLIADQRMTINLAVRKALAAIDERRRGSRGAGRK